MAQPQPEPTPTYDVFISYSHADQVWVGEWLVPRLKAAGLAVCTDQESFDIGVPSLVNMENAVAASRHTLLVLTEAWVRSQWTQYEALLVQTDDPSGLFQRTLPVLRRPCAPPRRIGMLTYADLTGQGDTEAEFAKLLDAIRGVRRLPDAGATATTLGLSYDLRGAAQAAEAAEVERDYRDQLVSDLTWHDFRGMYQFEQHIRLPLAEIYQELGLLKIGGAEEHRKTRERMLVLDEAERMAEVERRVQERVSGALARSQRLVILGDPGAGKTISLKFIALMLASRRGAERLALAAPYLPVMVRLAHFAQALAQEPALSLDNYLLQVIPKSYTTGLADFVRLALGRGACILLLDGLDEVGDNRTTGQSLRKAVVKRVQQFADRWCTDDRPNRLVVTSRIEGYWSDALANCDHVEISPLSPPDEVEQFLLRWYDAHERHRVPAPLPEVARARAAARVANLLPQLMDTPSVKRLATNPLLLTILVLISDKVPKLPQKRAKLYAICTKTLIESWRQEQTEQQSKLLSDLGEGGEEIVTRVIADLAFWLHEHYPGGAASLGECRDRLLAYLTDDEGYERPRAQVIADGLLSFASCEAGLLCERGLGQYGFFHLTFEEYLAGYHLTRTEPAQRHDILTAHWRDGRWREVILLAAGQLGVVDNRQYDAGGFLNDLRSMEPTGPDDAGRPAVLAGRALADIGASGVNPTTRRDVLRELRQTMQDRDLETDRLNEPPRIPVLTRYAAGEAWDELGGLPEDLDAWVYCAAGGVRGNVPGTCEVPGTWQALLAAKYPITNAQFERFIQADGYDKPGYWGGKDSPGWRWRMKPPDYRGAGPVTQPEYWQRPRFGKDRRGYPVVGISWHEAAAYAAWLTERLRIGDFGLRIVSPNGVNPQSVIRNPKCVVRLPTDAEWLWLAGGEKEGERERYPWDVPGSGRVTDFESEEGKKTILARANTAESGIGGTSPVAMYPLGESKPFGLWDVAGNVWEWNDLWHNQEQSDRVVRGGSWYHSQWLARPSVRLWDSPDYSLGYIGFRLVSPISSGF
ncbi:MAG: SUMF1/EgtB/PvdO family nonheme iron enzyme [Chloroflexi bacterium]|nr:SUMF1/EgtB/PvdO family nonheme iron enzyme [Chloroflexota bacterium]